MIAFGCSTIYLVYALMMTSIEDPPKRKKKVSAELPEAKDEGKKLQQRKKGK